MELKNKYSFFYEKENNLLNLFSIPYIGIYSYNYTFLMPCNILHSKSIPDSLFKTLPGRLKSHITEINSNFTNVPIDIDFFVTTLDGSYINSKYSQNNSEGLLRLNFVPHPYIFENVKSIENDHSTYIYSSMYADGEDFSFRETNEYDGLRINPDKLINDSNKKEIILHKSNDGMAALSPNNCAFLINTNKVFSVIYNFTIVLNKNKVAKLMVGQYNIFMNNNYFPSNVLTYFDTCYKISTSSTDDLIANLSYIKNYFRKFCFLYNKPPNDFNGKDYTLYIKNIFNLIFNKNYSTEESVTNNIENFYFNELCFFVWSNMLRLNIPNLGEDVLLNNKVFCLEILEKYLRKLANNFDTLIDSYLIILRHNILNDNLYENSLKQGEIICEKEIKDISNSPEILNIHLKKSKQSNPQLQIFREILESAFNVIFLIFKEIMTKFNLESIKQKVAELDLPYQNILFSRTWERKGKFMGIHNDFGKFSFINSELIPNNYHCSQEEMVEIILEIIATLESFDEK